MGFELAHVLASRPLHAVIVLQLAPCPLPAALAGSVPIDASDPSPAAQDAAFAELLARLCPAGGSTVAEAGQVGPQDGGCLSGPRVVDSLFDAAGALLIADDEPASPLALRLVAISAR